MEPHQYDHLLAMQMWSYSNEVGHYGATSFKHVIVLHMNTFKSTLINPFRVIFQPYDHNSLQLSNVTKENHVHVMRTGYGLF